MSWNPNRFTPFWGGKLNFSTDPKIRGVEYLKMMQELALVPSMIEVLDDASSSTCLPVEDSLISFGQASHFAKPSRTPANMLPESIEVVRDRITTWIGNNIEVVNEALNLCLDACHDCFHPQEQRLVEIFAVPLASRFGIDGFCNILIEPAVIFIDVGRIAPEDWLTIVVHEYAHAHLGSPGHNHRFLAIMEHLCLGLGLQPPPCRSDMPLPEIEARLRNWPPYHSNLNPLAFWMGNF